MEAIVRLRDSDVTFLKSQWDKALVSCLFLAMCALAYFSSGNDKLSTFALQSATGFLGCLLTLVTARRGVDLVPFPPDPTSSTTTASSTVQTVTKTDPKAPE